VIVIDASVLANALADDGVDGDAARTAIRSDPDLAAPDLVDVETVAVLRKQWLTKKLTARRFRISIADLTDFAIVRYPTLPFMARAYELRSNVSSYDAAYVALAETLDCPLLTADRRLANASGPRCEIRVVSNR